MPKVSKEASNRALGMALIGVGAGLLFFCVGIILILVVLSILRNYLGLSLESNIVSSFVTVSVLILLSILVMIGVTAILFSNHNKKVEKFYRGLRISNIDAMTGIEFEQYLQRLLTNRGYSVSTTKASGDLGVDLIALGNTEKIAIQAKRFNTKVSRRAISDAVAGMNFYGCNKSMVITNNYFSPGAVALAKSTGCILVDRDALAVWVNEYNDANYKN